MKSEQDKLLDEVTGGEYKYGFVTDIENDLIPQKGLNEDVVRLISAKKGRAGVASGLSTKGLA